MALAGELEDRRPLSEELSRAGGRVVGIAMVLIVVVGLAAGLAVAGNPVHRVDNASARVQAGRCARPPTRRAT